MIKKAHTKGGKAVAINIGSVYWLIWDTRYIKSTHTPHVHHKREKNKIGMTMLTHQKTEVRQPDRKQLKTIKHYCERKKKRSLDAFGRCFYPKRLALHSRHTFYI